jgi:hypothetical protein
MFSERIYLNIAGLTESALGEMPTAEAVDQVTIIRGYVQLSTGGRGLYDDKVRDGINALLDLARQKKKRLLIHALQDLLDAMDQERNT